MCFQMSNKGKALDKEGLNMTAGNLRVGNAWEAWNEFKPFVQQNRHTRARAATSQESQESPENTVKSNEGEIGHTSPAVCGQCSCMVRTSDSAKWISLIFITNALGWKSFLTESLPCYATSLFRSCQIVNGARCLVCSCVKLSWGRWNFIKWE